MYNDDEIRNGADLNSTEPIPDETQNNPYQPADFTQQTPAQAEPVAKEASASPYYEPWQRPVYSESKAPAREPYSPGIHNGAYSAYQRFQPTEPQPEKKRKSGFGFFKAISLVLACLIASGGATYGVMQYTLNDFKNSNQVVLSGDNDPEVSTPTPSLGAAEEGAAPSADAPETPSNVTPTGSEMSAKDIYAMAVNQVVGVNSEEKTNVFGAPTSGAVSGSGFIISDDGYIVTNYHVIQYAAEMGFSLTVMLHNGESYPAKIIGSEPDNDLAVIKIDASGLSAATLGNNDTMKVGDEVYAVGNPLGELDYTMTSGIVSALDRDIQVDEVTRINMFQIDAAVNPGNSGGPLYNSKGEVIGIVSAKYASTGVEGLGFAIPINDALDIAEQLMTDGHVSGKPYMGISVKSVTQQAAEYYEIVVGAYVITVEKGSCADTAGMKVGDIITKLGDYDVTSKEDLLAAKKNFKAGETTSIVVYRDGESLTLQITFDEEGIMTTASDSTPQPVLP
jgi:serine protease Do